MTTKFSFSHETRRYTFKGRAIDPPRPGTYDARHFTPPTHQYFHVEIQNDGLWCIKLFDTEIKS